MPESQRVEDPDLTDIGVQQAQRLAERVDALRLSHVVTSPFLRTLLTTKAIAERTSLRPQVHVNLHEVGGCYAGVHQRTGRPGMSGEQIRQRFPDFEVGQEINHQGWWAGRPFESQHDALRRAERLKHWTLESFADDSTEPRIAYVMHADFKVVFLEHLQLPVRHTPWNTSVTELRSNRERFELVRYNCTEHLDSELHTM